MEELSIKVNIADRIYPLIIQADGEETVRKAAKLINDKIKLLQQTFAVKDKQDILAMIVLEMTTELIKIQSKSTIDDDGISEEIEQIQSLLKQIKI